MSAVRNIRLVHLPGAKSVRWKMFWCCSANQKSPAAVRRRDGNTSLKPEPLKKGKVQEEMKEEVKREEIMLDTSSVQSNENREKGQGTAAMEDVAVEDNVRELNGQGNDKNLNVGKGNHDDASKCHLVDMKQSVSPVAPQNVHVIEGNQKNTVNTLQTENGHAGLKDSEPLSGHEQKETTKAHRKENEEGCAKNSGSLNGGYQKESSDIKEGGSHNGQEMEGVSYNQGLSVVEARADNEIFQARNKTSSTYGLPSSPSSNKTDRAKISESLLHAADRTQALIEEKSAKGDGIEDSERIQARNKTPSTYGLPSSPSTNETDRAKISEPLLHAADRTQALIEEKSAKGDGIEDSERIQARNKTPSTYGLPSSPSTNETDRAKISEPLLHAADRIQALIEEKSAKGDGSKSENNRSKDEENGANSGDVMKKCQLLADKRQKYFFLAAAKIQALAEDPIFASTPSITEAAPTDINSGASKKCPPNLIRRASLPIMGGRSQGIPGGFMPMKIDFKSALLNDLKSFKWDENRKPRKTPFKKSQSTVGPRLFDRSRSVKELVTEFDALHEEKERERRASMIYKDRTMDSSEVKVSVSATQEDVEAIISNAITTLALISKGLKSIPKKVLGLKMLEQLHMEDNDIVFIPEDISKLHNLKDLALNNNNIITLPHTVGKFRELQSLSLAKNRIVEIPGEIGDMKTLENLLLQTNILATLPKEIGRLTSLKILNLSENSLVVLPDEVGCLESLERLSLQKNKLHTLPKTIGKLRHLTYLSVERNKLSEIPVEVGMLESLEILNLAKNELSTLPEEIKKLSGLEELYLHSNLLKIIPPGIAKLNGLKVLSLYENSLGDIIFDFSSMCSLESLQLQNNRITSVSSSLGELEALKHLNLSWNRLGELPIGVPKLENLQKLQLVGNGLIDLPDMSSLKALEKLRLEYNRIREYPTGINHIKEVELTGNHILEKVAPNGAEENKQTENQEQLRDSEKQEND